MIEAGLIAYLLDTDDVTDLVGDRIHVNARPQEGELPAIVIRRISGPRYQVLRGPAGLAHPRIQVDCLAYTAIAAKQLADVVRLAKGTGALPLECFQGMMGSGDYQRKVQHIRLDDDRDDYIEPEHENERGVHVVSMDFIVWYVEPGR